MMRKAIDLGKRFRRMERVELVHRCGQALAARSDCLMGWFGQDIFKPPRALGDPHRSNFFFTYESVDSILSLIKTRLHGRAEQIIEEAERILEHRFDLLGYQGLDYGNRSDWIIDWHLDAVSGKRAPRRAFYRLRYLDFNQCGDSKVIWELNRHQHFVTLAKAFRLTGDPRYIEELISQWRHWQSVNPYPFGINWASSLEVAIRSLSWLWSYQLLRGTEHIVDCRDEWLRGFALHGRHIERYLSTYFSPNTHLLGEGVGLFFLGVLCPELHAAKRWRAIGWDIVVREAERQTQQDGFHFEQSTYYHVYALDFILHAVVLAHLNGIEVPQSLEHRVERMLSALCLMSRFGPPPNFGDDDGGRVFDPRRNCTEHLRDPLATGAILFHRGDFKAVAAGLREETLWLLGEEGVREWDRLRQAPVDKRSGLLAEAGYHLLASEEEQLVVDCGPMGSHGAGHGHADALSVCLQSRGEALLIDCGAFEYVGPGRNRERFRGTGMHNTVQVDGLSQAEPATAFSWRTLARTKVERWVQGQDFDFLQASHDGYRSLQQPVTHRRWVVSLRKGFYLVRDVLEGNGAHRIDIAWHLAPGLEQVREGRFRSRDSEVGIEIVSSSDQDWKTELREEMYSPRYGQKAPAMTLHFTSDRILPAEFACIVKIISDEGKAAPSFRHFDGPGTTISRYEYGEDDQHYSFVFNERAKVWDSGSFSGDAEFVCHGRDARNEVSLLIMCSGTYTRAGHDLQLTCSRSVEWAELMISSADRWYFSSDVSAIVNCDVVKPGDLAGASQV